MCGSPESSRTPSAQTTKGPQMDAKLVENERTCRALAPTCHAHRDATDETVRTAPTLPLAVDFLDDELFIQRC